GRGPRPGGQARGGHARCKRRRALRPWVRKRAWGLPPRRQRAGLLERAAPGLRALLQRAEAVGGRRILLPGRQPARQPRQPPLRRGEQQERKRPRDLELKGLTRLRPCAVTLADSNACRAENGGLATKTRKHKRKAHETVPEFCGSTLCAFVFLWPIAVPSRENQTGRLSAPRVCARVGGGGRSPPPSRVPSKAWRWIPGRALRLEDPLQLEADDPQVVVVRLAAADGAAAQNAVRQAVVHAVKAAGA